MIRKVMRSEISQTLSLERFTLSWQDRLRKWGHLLFYDWGILLFAVGFLLGRAIILSELTPFVLPFIAAVYVLHKEKTPVAMLSVVAGSLTSAAGNVSFVFVAVVLFVLLQKICKRFTSELNKVLPYIVFSAIVGARFLLLYVTSREISEYALMMAAVEAGLGFILTMIFLQSVPFLTEKTIHYPLKNEEIVSLVILLASVMTGTIGWAVYDLTVEHILARYLVLLFAFVAGAAIGSTVGVVTGLILSLASVANLYHMSLLAFSGLLGGLLKEGKKIGVSAGLFIGTFFIGLYSEGAETIWLSAAESLVAIILFFLTPKAWTDYIARYVPGTLEHTLEQQQYLRKIRDITAGRIKQFSQLFRALSKSFSVSHPLYALDREREIDLFLSNVTEKTCQGCIRKKRCWVEHFEATYEALSKVMEEIEKNGEVRRNALPAEWCRQCFHSEKVFEVMKEELHRWQANKKLRKQVQEGRKLVADQLLGVSKVMHDFAKEIQKEKDGNYAEEEEMVDALRQAGLAVGHIDIFSLQPGNIEIEMSVAPDYGTGQYEKVIAPMLSDLLNETIVVKNIEYEFYPNGYSHVSFGSQKKFAVDIGIATVAKGGAWISGDSYATIELPSGKYAIAISDGMGNGERARLESSETLKLLENILQSGIEETVAIKSVNSVLALRSTEEIFSTLDLAMIDLQNAKAKFLKIGSTPSFIKRGQHVMKIEANNLPIGMLEEFDVEVVSEQLKSGDLLIMMSDGIFDAPKHVENKELWLKRIISEIKANDPQEIADHLLERVIRSGHGEIGDDMTVIVASIQRSMPKWAAIPLHHTVRKRKKKKRGAS